MTKINTLCFHQTNHSLFRLPFKETMSVGCGCGEEHIAKKKCVTFQCETSCVTFQFETLREKNKECSRDWLVNTDPDLYNDSLKKKP